MGKSGTTAKAAESGSKKNSPGFLLQQGEKLAIGLGLLGLIALSLWGAMTYADTTSPDAIVKEMTTKVSAIRAAINGDGEGAPPLPEWVKKGAAFPPVPPEPFALAGPIFEPIHQPDLLRENPRVLGIVSWQIDPIRGPMRSLDVLLPTDPNGRIKIGVLVNKPIAAKDRGAFQRDLKGFLSNIKNVTAQRPANRPERPRRPGGPPAAGPMPMNPMPGAEGAIPGAGYDPYGSSIPASIAVSQREDKTVQYVNIDDVEKQNLPLAETIFPLRALMVQMAFPLKEQLEEIRRALRLQSRQEAAIQSVPTPPVTTGLPGMAPGFNGGVPGAIPGAIPGAPAGPGAFGPGAMNPNLAAGPGPIFDGFDVERRIILPSGEVLDWTPYNHEEEFFTKIRSRKIAYVPDSEYLPYFLRYDQRLAAPLPELADKLASYPPVRIPQIYDAIAKLHDQAQPPVTETEWQKRFRSKAGDQNPYAVDTIGAGVFGVGATNPEMTPMPIDPTPRGPGRFDPMANQPVPQGPEVDVLLLRFLDVDVLPGYSYQYRVRVRMKNPNYGKTKEVREPSDAKKEILEGPWVVIPEVVSLPPESHLYAYDTSRYVKTFDDLSREYAGSNSKIYAILSRLFDVIDVKRGHHAAIQMQTWLPQVRSSGSTVEPVGTWVVAEMPVVPGEYVGRRQLVKLPLWSSSAAGYVLRELSNAVAIEGVPPQNQPKGWPVNFQTKSVLIDFEGGNIKTDVGNRTIEDQTATELLILLPDGKLTLRNSAIDMADEGRKERDQEWNDWIKRVSERRDASTNPMNDSSGFGPRIKP